MVTQFYVELTHAFLVVNMMSNDTAQLQRFLHFVGMTMVAPLQIIVALILIYRQVSLCLIFAVFR